MTWDQTINVVAASIMTFAAGWQIAELAKAAYQGDKDKQFRCFVRVFLLLITAKVIRL